MTFFNNLNFLSNGFFNGNSFWNCNNWFGGFSPFNFGQTYNEFGMYGSSIFQAMNPDFSQQYMPTAFCNSIYSIPTNFGGNIFGSNSYINPPVISVDRSTTLTSEMKEKILDGTYTGDKVSFNNVTHYSYEECADTDLVVVGEHKLHKDAADAFAKMQKAAEQDGITLTVVSGFRSKEYQKTLFSKKGTDDATIKDRIKVSAPAGFSEHHTGYAIDINSTEETFKDSDEYRWLKEHASEYGFELSFPENNSQGVAFEPWHWRYVGNEEAKNTFAKARASKK